VGFFDRLAKSVIPGFANADAHSAMAVPGETTLTLPPADAVEPQILIGK
jgi:hypothetical protein